ncbi:MAG: phosphoglycerate kinase [Eubacteriales bacterium]
MKFGINTLDDFEVKGKTVLLRVDINEPIDKKNERLKDITRIKASERTIRELSDRKAKVVILAHQGSDIEYKNFYSTKPHAKVLTDLLEKPVRFIDDISGPAAQTEIKKLEKGEILLLDNVRFMSEEQTLFENNLKLTPQEQAETLLVKKLAPLADIYVCDAFAAAHRSQPSLCGFEQVMPSAMGRLFEEEYSILSRLMGDPKRPCVFVLGGSKINDAFAMMNSVLSNGIADKILTGGLVGEVMAWGEHQNIGKATRAYIKKLGYDNHVDDARELMRKYRQKIEIPVDYACVVEGKRYEVKMNTIPDSEIILDIGRETVEIYRQEILKAKTIFVNGPMGVFEDIESEYGTQMIWDALANTQGYTVIGGGDSITATKKYNKVNSINYICTGGGSLIRFLSGEDLPVIKALRFATKFNS